jgi:mRNA deadenylase 3'-5' endonuclease subunit Ccr4
MAGPKGQLPEHKEVKENMDAMAACAQPGDGANSPDDVVPTDKNKKLIQMSKSARIIKDIYKRKGMKEEIYDHEKEDKSVATYGKKPKLQEPKENSTKEDPQAAAIMTGGTTLSGQARDTIEIDPMLKMRRPDQNQQKYK